MTSIVSGCNRSIVKWIVSLVFGTTIALLNGCSTDGSWIKTASDFEKDAQRKHELDMMDKQCSPAALVGTTSGFSAALDGKRDELKSIKASLSLETYNRLSQKLDGYSVEWETLNQQVKIACNQNAVCLARNSNSGSCYDSDSKYMTKVKEANDIVRSVRTLDLTKAGQ